MYRIEYDYTTGDSFHSERLDGETLEGEWETLKTAKENLLRLKEHYEWYVRYNHILNSRKEKQEMWKNMILQRWSVDGESWLKETCLMIVADNGKEYQIHPPWIGYFETLHALRIVSPPEDGMEFDFDNY